MTIYAEAEALMAQPALIKQSLPLAFVMEQYGVALQSDGQRLTGRCCFHQDNSPSMDVYSWGAGERWGCWACGAGGDVLDFVMRMSGVGFREACEICLRGIERMKALGWERPVLGAVFEWNAPAAEDLLRRASIVGLQGIIDAKGWCFPESHLLNWGCRVQGEEMLVPVWDETKSLVGLKHRPLSGARSLLSLPGSRLRTTLYGAHGDTLGRTECLLTEGESDAWTASYVLRMFDVHVMSLPAGCGASPTRLDLLARYSNVHLAFDGDDPGRMSAARWKDALGESAVILDLPDGEDITSVTRQDPAWLTSRMES